MFKSQKLLKIAGLNLRSPGLPMVPAKVVVGIKMPAPRAAARANLENGNLLSTELRSQNRLWHFYIKSFGWALVAADPMQILARFAVEL